MEETDGAVRTSEEYLKEVLMNSHHRKPLSLAAAILAMALTACGTETASDDTDPPAGDRGGTANGAGASVGGPAEPLTVDEARAVEPGEVIRLRGALVLDGQRATLCEALAESYPPSCPNGLVIDEFDASILGPDTPRSGSVRWLEGLELIAVRTEKGLTYQRGSIS